MSGDFAKLAESLISAKNVDDAEVAKLRSLLWQNANLPREAVQSLLALNDALVQPHAGFCDLLGEAVTHLLLRQDRPRNYISDDNAEWLIQCLTKDGRVESYAELELLVRVIEQAENASERLRNFALDQIEMTVLHGVGPTRRGGACRPGCIDEAEVELLRRVIFAAGGASATIVSEAEANMFFRLKDLTKVGKNAPQWSNLFVQAVANHLMAYSSYRPLELEEAQRLERFMDDTSPNVGRFLTRVMGSVSLSSLFGSGKDSEEKILHSESVEAARQISDGEANWLRAQIAADSDTDELEKAVLAFIADEGVSLPPLPLPLRKSA